MNRVRLNRKQIEKIVEAFQKYDIDEVDIYAENTSGIGPTVYAEIVPKFPVKIDITDYESW